MILKISESVPLKEYCRIIANGKERDRAKAICLTISKEAMIGFASELLVLYGDIDARRKLFITTYPLVKESAPNQALGFYLTPTSPTLGIKIGNLEVKGKAGQVSSNELPIRYKNSNQYYSISETLEETELEKNGFLRIEPYELSRCNLIDIRIEDNGGNDITKEFSSVVIEINKEGIKAFATMLLVWANNYFKEKEYAISQDGDDGHGYNLGIILSDDSIPTKIKTSDLGSIFDYVQN